MPKLPGFAMQHLSKIPLQKMLVHLSSRADLLTAGFVMVVVMMMIAPLPKGVVDGAIALSFSVAILLVAIVTYIPNPLAFSTFPTLLLIVTAFRLAISISTTRLVLLEADAGHLVEAFGQFVVGGNAVVGFVMFLILTVVQFLVVTKGAERIAEVSARFSLDSLPGKQLSIDSDLRAGFIDAREAKRRRGELTRESQLFGAMDGAMKFVKGDAIAGLIIVGINLIGGFAVGMLQHNMTASESVSRFTLLTIGDGLIAQIPALLIALASGLLIARVAPNLKEKGEQTQGADTMGHEIVNQMTGEPRAWFFSGAVIALFALIPGVPAWLFFVLSGIAVGVGLLTVRAERRSAADRIDEGDLATQGRRDLRRIMPNTPLSLVAASTRDTPEFAAVIEHVRRVRNAVVAEYGLTLPSLVVSFNDSVSPDEVQLCFFETPQLRMSFRPADIAVRVAGDDPVLAAQWLADAYTAPTAFQEIGWYWVSQEVATQLPAEGLIQRSWLDFAAVRIRLALLDYGPQFLGLQEMRAFVGWLDRELPELAKEVQRCVPNAKLASLLQQLARERIPVRNMRLIAENLVTSGLHERDPEVIVDFLRQCLRDDITMRYAKEGTLRMCVLHADMEDMLRSCIRQSPVGVYLELPPDEVANLTKIFTAHVYPSGTEEIAAVVVVAADLRRPLAVAALGARVFIPVLTFAELSSAFRTEVVARLEWPEAEGLVANAF